MPVPAGRCGGPRGGIGALLALALAATLMAALPVAAQAPVDPPFEEIRIRFEPTDDPVAMGESRRTNATVTVTCSSPALYTDTVRVLHAVDSSAEWMEVEVEPAHMDIDFAPQECLTGAATREYEVAVTVRALLGAPGLVDAAMNLGVTEPGAPATAVTWRERVRMEGDFRIRIDEAYREEDGVGIVSGSATNNANGPIRVRFELLEPPGRGDVEVPAPLQVGSRALAQDDNASFAIRLDTDGRGAVGMTLRVVAVAAADASHVVPPGYDLKLLVEPGKGRVQWTTDPEEELEAPGPGPLFGVVLAALWALWRRGPKRAPAGDRRGCPAPSIRGGSWPSACGPAAARPTRHPMRRACTKAKGPWRRLQRFRSAW